MMFSSFKCSTVEFQSGVIQVLMALNLTHVLL